MPVVFRCPHCGQDGQSSADVSGQTVRCHGCNQTFWADAGTSAQIEPFLPPDVGDTVGPFKLLAELGKGGMGVVYLAEDTMLGRRVAIKIPTRELARESAEWKRFQREARSAAALDHPNICSVYAVIEHAGRPCIALKFVEGQPLSKRIEEGRPWEPEVACKLVATVARAMQYAHDRGVIHRDLKPENIMLTPAGEPVVTDFGLAKAAGGKGTMLTMHGTALGSPAYMPPEQWQGSDAVGPAADVYALGVVLFELLSGHRPYTGVPFEIMMEVATGPVPLLRSIRPDADPRLEEVCRRAMAKEPTDRFPSMAALAEAVADAGRTDPPTDAGPMAVVVDAAGGGDFRRIPEAVAAARPGTLIRVRPGVYREPVELDKDIRLEGDGDRTVVIIETSGGPAVHVRGGDPVVRNMTLRAGYNGTGPKQYGVLISAGRPTLGGCVISSGSLACLTVENRGTAPLVTDCDIAHGSDRQGNGIAVRGRAGGVFEGCRVRGNFAGLWVCEGGNPVVRGCTFSDNEFAVQVQDGGRGSFDKCTMFGGRYGVEVSDAGDPIVRGCTITGTGTAAVSVDSSGKGTFTGNDLRGNRGRVWALEAGSTVTRRENVE